MKNVYGWTVLGSGFQETGFSEKGAKVAATLSGCDHVVVGYRSSTNNMFIETATKICGTWVKTP